MLKICIIQKKWQKLNEEQNQHDGMLKGASIPMGTPDKNHSLSLVSCSGEAMNKETTAVAIPTILCHQKEVEKIQKEQGGVMIDDFFHFCARVTLRLPACQKNDDDDCCCDTSFHTVSFLAFRFQRSTNTTS